MSIKYLISNKRDLCYFYYYYQYYWHFTEEHMQVRVNFVGEPSWAYPLFFVPEPTLLIGSISGCELLIHQIYQQALLNTSFPGLEGKMSQTHSSWKPEDPVIRVTNASPEGSITWPLQNHNFAETQDQNIRRKYIQMQIWLLWGPPSKTGSF